MLREFFCSGPANRLIFAWFGLIVFLGHAVFKAWLKWALNNWYAEFYDELQDIGYGVVNQTNATAHFALKRDAVSEQLIAFTIIVSPAVIVHPLAKWIASVWRFSWRMALVKSYLVHYDVAVAPVEGAAQRIQEDTSRFEEGVYSCFSIVLDSVLTLLIFVPVLLQVGTEAHLPNWDWPPWLILIAVSAANGGLLISMIIGHPLVRLEVINQKVEASFRTKLVMLEQRPVAIVGGRMSGEEICDELHFDDIMARPPPPRAIAPLVAFHAVIADLWKNYRKLFRNFAWFNTWISFYDQTMTIIPFLLVAPLMFADNPTDRITLGTLMKVSNAFDKVFSAMAVVTENWSAVRSARSHTLHIHMHPYD